MSKSSVKVFGRFKLFSIFFLLVSNILMPCVAFADANVITTEKDLVSTLKVICNSFGAFAVFIALIFSAIKLILNNRNPEERENLMSAISRIIIGAIILGLASGIVSILLNMQREITVTKNPNITEMEYLKVDEKAKELEDEDDTFFMRAIVAPINAISNLVYGGDDDEGILNKVLGFKSLDQLIYTQNTDISPFEETEWSNLIALYIKITTVCVPLLFIMVAKTGFSFIINSSSPNKIQEAKEDLSRWFFSIFIIAVGPFLIRFIFLLCGSLTNILGATVKTGDFKDKLDLSKGFVNGIHTGSIFTTAIVKFMFAGINFKINLVFIVRKIILSVMVVFTPLAATFWGINKKVNAFQVWIGEILTNASLSFFYALTFTIMNVTIGKSTLGNWIYVILWMMMCMKIADMLRNTLQGFITRLSGMNELNEARRGGLIVGSMVGGAMGAFSAAGMGIGNVRKGSGKFTSSGGGGNASQGGASANDGLINSSMKTSSSPSNINPLEKSKSASTDLNYSDDNGISLNKNAQSSVDKAMNGANGMESSSSSIPNSQQESSMIDGYGTQNSQQESSMIDGYGTENDIEQMADFYKDYSNATIPNEESPDLNDNSYDVSQNTQQSPTDFSGEDMSSPMSSVSNSTDMSSSIPSSDTSTSSVTSNGGQSPNYANRVIENFNKGIGNQNKGKTSSILGKTGSALKTAGSFTGKALSKTASVAAPVIANMVTGGDIELRKLNQSISKGIPQIVNGGIGAVKGTSNAVGNLGNSIKMGNAVYQTAKEVAKEENISKNEALTKIMGTKSSEGAKGNLSAYINSAKIVTAAGSQNNGEKVTKIIAGTPSYTGIESFNGWKDWDTEKNSGLERTDN